MYHLTNYYRWHNHLNPSILKASWTDEEEWLLFLHHKAYGSSWAKIAKSIEGRTDNSIKNHWNSAMRRKVKEYTERYNKIKDNKIKVPKSSKRL